MNLRFIDWIWHVRGHLTLAPGLSSSEAFDRLEPLFHQPGTSHQRSDNALIFTKKNQAAQDKMAVFDGGILRVDYGMAGRRLSFDLTSRALLMCFLAPLLFLGLSQTTIVINKFDKPVAAPAKKHPPMVLNPIDKALGVPAPDNSKKAEDDKKPTPTAGYVFAGIFAALYLIGRVLEHRLIQSLLKKRLRNIDPDLCVELPNATGGHA